MIASQYGPKFWGKFASREKASDDGGRPRLHVSQGIRSGSGLTSKNGFLQVSVDFHDPEKGAVEPMQWGVPSEGN